MKNSDKKVMSAYLPHKLIEAVAAEADRSGMSKSKFIAAALATYLKVKQKRRQLEGENAV